MAPTMEGKLAAWMVAEWVDYWVVSLGIPRVAQMVVAMVEMMDAKTVALMGLIGVVVKVELKVVSKVVSKAGH